MTPTYMTPAHMPPSDDIDRIMTVMQTAFDPAYGEAWTRRQIEDALLLGQCDTLLIAPDGTKPAPGTIAAGFALTRTTLDEDELLLFAIAPAFRRRGLGKTLLNMVIARARARHCARIFLEMRDGNSAEHLYRAAGFSPVGRRPKYYRTTSGELLDAIIFSHKLA